MKKTTAQHFPPGGYLAGAGSELFRAFVLMALCGLGTQVCAQSALPDPTRPPVGASTAEGGALAGEAAGPVLQSVIVPKKGKPSALISGQLVTLGGLYGESRLKALSEKEAVLEGPMGIERLRLTPSVEKNNIVAKTSAAKGAQGKGKP